MSVSETKDPIYFPNLKQSVGLVILLFIIQIPFFILRKKAGDYNPHLNPSFTLLLTTCLETTILIFIGLMLMKKRNNDEYKLKFHRVNIVPVLIICFMGLSEIIIAKAITVFIPISLKTAEHFRKLYEPNIFNFIRAVIIVPITEEIFFRGIILAGLLKNHKSSKAIILSAVIFGLVHIYPSHIISAMLGGILIGWVYWKTNSLIPGIILHCLNNLMAFISWSRYLKFHDHPFLMVILVIISFVVITAGYKLLNQQLKTTLVKIESEDES